MHPLERAIRQVFSKESLARLQYQGRPVELLQTLERSRQLRQRLAKKYNLNPTKRTSASRAASPSSSSKTKRCKPSAPNLQKSAKPLKPKSPRRAKPRTRQSCSKKTRQRG